MSQPVGVSRNMKKRESDCKQHALAAGLDKQAFLPTALSFLQSRENFPPHTEGKVHG